LAIQRTSSTLMTRTRLAIQSTWMNLDTHAFAISQLTTLLSLISFYISNFLFFSKTSVNLDTHAWLLSKLKSHDTVLSFLATLRRSLFLA
jgi:hypothetical protein